MDKVKYIQVLKEIAMAIDEQSAITRGFRLFIVLFENEFSF